VQQGRSTWLITSLSPGAGEKMSKHSVPAGDICALLARFSELKQKAFARTGKSFPTIVICGTAPQASAFFIQTVHSAGTVRSYVRPVNAVMDRWPR
jgi:transposase